jgi:hypothetical protein
MRWLLISQKLLLHETKSVYKAQELVTLLSFGNQVLLSNLILAVRGRD